MNDPLVYPFPSRRATVFGNKAMAATSQPLAAQAGLDVMRHGGNAVDAAVAMAMALTVLEPTSNGIGADAFCILWHEGRMYGLNASGPSPMGLTLEGVKGLGFDVMPTNGFIPVTVPGAPSAWAALSKRFGRLGLPKAAEAAVSYAREGYPVSSGTAESWLVAAKSYKKRLDPALFKVWGDTFLIDGKPPMPGQGWRSESHARTLEAIAATDADSFYRGELADRIDAYFRANGGFLRKSDLEGYAPQWVEPICSDYRGHQVWEIPPNGQGLVALMALKILDKLELKDFHDPVSLHLAIEAVKLAFTEGLRQIADPAYMEVSLDRLLSETLASERRGLISETALDPEVVPFMDHGTVYLCAADSFGNMVSYIQSNYMGFGSGVVIPETGIALQNRGANFSLNPDHPNRLTPGKRPYHTIIPGFLTKDGRPVGPFGIMGGFMQPQAHVQVLNNMLVYGMNPQAALDAPRWQWLSGRKVQFETGFQNHIVNALKRKGHDVEYSTSSTPFGRGQIIFNNPLGEGYVGATEPRTDGTVAAW